MGSLNALGVANVLERSIAAQNLAMVRMLPCYSDLELPRGSKKVLRSLTKTTAKKLMQSDEIQFDPKEKDFYHKDSPESKLSADQITVVESSLELFAEFTLDELLSFESKLEQNFAFAVRHPVGVRIYEILQNWKNFVSFENITYYHARTLGENQRPLCSILLHCWIYITILQKPEMRFLIRHSIISKVGYGYLHRYTLNI